uniref:Uncharacterized protein n=1 Tax=Medicago truncatula TaxID=3880 RepID=A4PSE6_MEDTR|nr:hypothetical protein MtrDRAFT_AC140550g44v2 [Medicago truncatula]
MWFDLMLGFNQSIQTATTTTTNHIQQKNEADMVPLKDCTPSDLTSLHTFSRDVNAGFAE